MASSRHGQEDHQNRQQRAAQAKDLVPLCIRLLEPEDRTKGYASLVHPIYIEAPAENEQNDDPGCTKYDRHMHNHVDSDIKHRNDNIPQRLVQIVDEGEAFRRMCCRLGREQSFVHCAGRSPCYWAPQPPVRCNQRGRSSSRAVRRPWPGRAACLLSPPQRPLFTYPEVRRGSGLAGGRSRVPTRSLFGQATVHPLGCPWRTAECPAPPWMIPKAEPCWLAAGQWTILPI
mmetsp:Transcript_17339/g.45257  ORF Transcript_17339/g.45257 Transcript_17339/m.45257 type:complete len:230 (-) Transcript_17339:137-826(-)